MLCCIMGICPTFLALYGTFTQDLCGNHWLRDVRNAHCILAGLFWYYRGGRGDWHRDCLIGTG